LPEPQEAVEHEEEDGASRKAEYEVADMECQKHDEDHVELVGVEEELEEPLSYQVK
jgi:predicted  nucleic acid-binding Zn-ribbon protein